MDYTKIKSIFAMHKEISRITEFYQHVCKCNLLIINLRRNLHVVIFITEWKDKTYTLLSLNKWQLSHDFQRDKRFVSPEANKSVVSVKGQSLEGWHTDLYAEWLARVCHWETRVILALLFISFIYLFISQRHRVIFCCKKSQMCSKLYKNCPYQLVFLFFGRMVLQCVVYHVPIQLRLNYCNWQWLCCILSNCPHFYQIFLPNWEKWTEQHTDSPTTFMG